MSALFKMLKRLRNRAHSAEKVGLFSRIDYFRPGFRVGLLEAGFEVFRRESVRYVVLVGGLISNRHYLKALRQLTDEYWSAEKESRKTKPKADWVNIDQVRAQAVTDLQETAAKALADAIPQLLNEQGKFVKIYLALAPSGDYDGPSAIGIADRLSELRPDIFYWGEKDVRFPVKNLGRECHIGVLLPDKSSWRSKYYSTQPDRLIEDKEKQMDETPPDIWVAGCGASALTRPSGELVRPQITVPGSHKIDEVRTAENQVGVVVLKFFRDSETIPKRTYNFKDFTATERLRIEAPAAASEMQKAILDVIKTKRADTVTIGVLEDELPWARSTIARAIRDYQGRKLQPEIIYNPQTKKFDIDEGWLQNNIRYPLPELEECKKDSLLGFGCLHAGYKTSQRKWFKREVAKISLLHRIKNIVGAGDFIAGLKHELDLRGEVVSGMANYTRQEDLAARTIAIPMLEAFRVRFDLLWKSKPRGRPNEKWLKAAVDEALQNFLYYWGNHDKWELAYGITPLRVFHDEIVSFLTKGIETVLAEKKLRLHGINHLVSEHVRFGRIHELPSGLNMGLLHPEMARAATSSLRAQHALAMRLFRKCQVMVIANFHIGQETQEFHPDLGQRICQQEGTIASGTDFEDGKMKSVDTGVGVLKIFSNEGRVFMVESFFHGPHADELVDDDEASTSRDLLDPPARIA